MLLYADEDFPYPVVLDLRHQGHDVLTVQEDGHSGADDVDLLTRAHVLGRALLTHNRRHFERLHRQGWQHWGIVTCTHDPDFASLAARIHLALSALVPGPWCLRINRLP